MNRHRSAFSRPFAQRAGIIVGCAVLAATLAACSGSVPASGDVRMGRAEGEAIAVVARDNEFVPATLRLPAGTEATLEIVNEDKRAHNFVIDELDLSTGTLKEGDVATATITVPDKAVGYYCSFHSNMRGQLVPASG
jgi:plastocyanin